MYSVGVSGDDVGLVVCFSDSLQLALADKSANGLFDFLRAVFSKFSGNLGLGSGNRAECDDVCGDLVLPCRQEFPGKHDGDAGISFDTFAGPPIEAGPGAFEKRPDLSPDLSALSVLACRAVTMDNPDRFAQSASHMPVVYIDEDAERFINREAVQVDFVDPLQFPRHRFI